MPEDKEELIDALQTTLDRFKAEFIGVGPDWGPLENLLPQEWWGAWMFMERIEDIRCYKHGITRQYLYIDSEGRCYNPRGSHWRVIDTKAAIDYAYAGIEKLGETRETKYDEEYKARKYAALEKRGITVIR